MKFLILSTSLPLHVLSLHSASLLAVAGRGRGRGDLTLKKLGQLITVSGGWRGRQRQADIKEDGAAAEGQRRGRGEGVREGGGWDRVRGGWSLTGDSRSYCFILTPLPPTQLLPPSLHFPPPLSGTSCCTYLQHVFSGLMSLF